MTQNSVTQAKTDLQQGTSGWQIAAASRRTTVHDTVGEYAFELAAATGWNLLTIAGSHKGSAAYQRAIRLAALSALQTTSAYLASAQGNEADATTCRLALERGLQVAWKHLSDEAARHQSHMRELDTDFTLLAHRPGPRSHLVGVAHAGGGLVSARLDNFSIVTLAEPDTNRWSSGDWQPLDERVSVNIMHTAPQLLMAASRDIALDYAGFDQRLEGLFDYLGGAIRQQPPTEAVLDLMDSMDGAAPRGTLAVIYRPGSRSGRAGPRHDWVGS